MVGSVAGWSSTSPTCSRPSPTPCPIAPRSIAGDRRLTYRELDERANRVAHYLRDVGVLPGQHVGIYSFNRAEWVESMLGCFKARAVPINVNYRYVVEELRYLFDNADLVALIFEAEFGPHVAPVLPGRAEAASPRAARRRHRHRHRRDSTRSTTSTRSRSSAPTRDGLLPRSPDDLYVLYTGGTTGMPKGVMWRAEDIFFAAMGGGNYGGPGIEQPADIVEEPERDPGRQLRARAADARQRAVVDVRRALRRQQR